MSEIDEISDDSFRGASLNLEGGQVPGGSRGYGYPSPLSRKGRGRFFWETAARRSGQKTGVFEKELCQDGLAVEEIHWGTSIRLVKSPKTNAALDTLYHKKKKKPTHTPPTCQGRAEKKISQTRGVLKLSSG